MERKEYAKKEDALFLTWKKTQTALFTAAKILAVMSTTNIYFMNMNSDSTVHFELVTQT